jgi:hypothetical protein
MLNFKQIVADLTQFLEYPGDFCILTSNKVFLQTQELKLADVRTKVVFFFLNVILVQCQRVWS